MRKRKHGLDKKRPASRSIARSRTKPLLSVTESERSKGIEERIVDVISKMRSGGVSLRKAAREAGVLPRTVIRRAPSALAKKGGRYKANPGDRLVRTLKIPTHQGTQELDVRGFRAASRLGRYWEAVHQYYATGNTIGLQNFSRKSITSVDGVKYQFLTDLDELNRLGSAGILSFESLYSRSS